MRFRISDFANLKPKISNQLIPKSEIRNLKSEITIVGAGRLGGALAIALERCGYRIVNLISRDVRRAEILAGKLHNAGLCFGIERLSELTATDVVLISTPDPEIGAAAERLAAVSVFKNKKRVFLHTSGSLSSEVLAALRGAERFVGSLHPLVSVSDAERGAGKFAGAYFCCEGDAEAVAVAEQIAADLGGNSFHIPTAAKPLYHAAAVMSAGHVVALFDAASATLAECGVEVATARQILLPLIRSTIENLATQTPAAALTGTFARADVETLKKHLAALDGAGVLPIYLELGRRSLELAAAQGADAVKLSEMAELLNAAEKS